MAVTQHLHVGGTREHVRIGPNIHVVTESSLMSPTLISSVPEASSSRSHYSWTAQALESVAFR